MVFTQQALLRQDHAFVAFFVAFIVSHEASVADFSSQERHWMCDTLLQALRVLGKRSGFEAQSVFGFVMKYCADETLSMLTDTFSDFITIKELTPNEKDFDLQSKWQNKERIRLSDNETLLSPLLSPSSLFQQFPPSSLSPTERAFIHQSFLQLFSTQDTRTRLNTLLQLMVEDAACGEKVVLLAPLARDYQTLSEHLSLIGTLSGIPQNAVILLCEWLLWNKCVLHSSPPFPQQFTLHEATTLLCQDASSQSLITFIRQYALLCELSDEEYFNVNRCVGGPTYLQSVLQRAVTSRNERQVELAFALLELGCVQSVGACLKAYLKSVLNSTRSVVVDEDRFLVVDGANGGTVPEIPGNSETV